MARGLRAGEPAPDFTALDETGATVTLADLRGGWAVLYFYPKDETPGCIREACSFRDDFGSFKARGITVFGVSRDRPESHRRFKEDRALPFGLLSDRRGDVLAAYGAAGLMGLPKRISFLIDPDGVVAAVHDSHLRPESHVHAMLKAFEAQTAAASPSGGAE